VDIKKLVEKNLNKKIKEKSEIKVAAMYLLSSGKCPLEKFKGRFFGEENKEKNS